ncbi:hypothetical protein K7887_22030 (plasmid) [Sutcliffiella horikoshii]|uniref:hypothetical protein n=1 Tax=Sutcliffiella horikoshii TaxID=79883 RepID=UPI001CBD2EBD|nr:hypothetical protein [Sutcliffiella horikoshii]UAL49727.1 hypothetical protein K7887_22030 [Sutcliffiella horikoshii]
MSVKFVTNGFYRPSKNRDRSQTNHSNSNVNKPKWQEKKEEKQKLAARYKELAEKAKNKEDNHENR